MEKMLPLFIAVTGAAVVLQACILAAMYLAMRKTSERVEAIAEEVKTKVLPAAEQAQALIADVRPKLEIVAENMQESTTMVRAQLQRLDATVNDIVDRARLQVIRGDELLTRTLDRVEQTTDMVHNTVVSPIRQFSGLMQGITVGLEFLFSGRAKRNGNNDVRRPVPQDEMFI